MVKNDDPLDVASVRKDVQQLVHIAARYTSDDEQIVTGVMRLVGGKFDPDEVRKMISAARAPDG